MKQRQAFMADLARTLHKLAHVYQMCVVVVNQVAADPRVSQVRDLVRNAKSMDEVGRGYLVREHPELVPSDAAGATGASVLWRAPSGARKVSSLALGPVAVRSNLGGDAAGRVLDQAGGPALGLEWARMVRHRVYLARPGHSQAGQTESSVPAKQPKPSYREMYVLAGMGVPNSLEVPDRRLVFEIREHGLVGLE
ncbi:hypothetical protein BCR44DRAFT_49297 [Catenaria anguillulae PL171]|uniref:Uncharacterized protein n=1 Tax=Catenaria anguillulae PL171 TaxID=765915 RepID=A0A1Y2I2A1_9FUNG|nr:hypothetical protein BCR44DRAFT_49297 [Catenaria anguillulae PL171]